LVSQIKAKILAGGFRELSAEKVTGIFEGEVIVFSRKLHSVYLYDYNFSANNIRMIKFMRMRWSRPVARMWEDRNTHRILVGKSERNRTLGSLRYIF
jgi:hypothetical protein